MCDSLYQQYFLLLILMTTENRVATNKALRPFHTTMLLDEHQWASPSTAETMHTLYSCISIL